jgi:hypothetical protein
MLVTTDVGGSEESVGQLPKGLQGGSAESVGQLPNGLQGFTRTFSAAYGATTAMSTMAY